MIRRWHHQREGKALPSSGVGVESSSGGDEAVGIKQEGARTRLENAVERKVTLAELWKAKPHHIQLLIQAVYDVLPNPSNLHTWGKA